MHEGNTEAVNNVTLNHSMCIEKYKHSRSVQTMNSYITGKNSYQIPRSLLPP